MKRNKFILLGGKQKKSNPNDFIEWKGFQRAIALELDLTSLVINQAFEHISPKENRVESEDASILFKCGHVTDDKLLTCTQTELLVYGKSDYSLKKCISLPSFNDVHHVYERKNGNYAIVSTGLDSLIECDQDGNIVSETPVGDFKIWQKFNRDSDYRKVLTTKPHAHHPNFCFEYKDDLWVTRFIDRDAINLRNRKTLSIDIGGPHDGEVVGDYVYFTTVNGYVVRIHIPTRRKKIYDLNKLNVSERLLGWCRSLQILEENKFVVGFSRVRNTKYKDYLQWLKRRLKSDAYPGCHPTRIAVYNFENFNFELDLNLEEYGMNAIFSILKI
jgi:hypothetical protein